ncbi:hypothetical protein [Glaciihabitans sp. UYNi722]|uniref:hypothetical protein n=1 Tax=Glaciihabitans sp. UYNi722 TaxID=3156344 RepID=UPI00339985F2
MNPIVIAVLVALLILTLWGFISPRGQWRVLTGWSRRDPYVSEPGAVVLGIHRLVAAVALVGVVAVGISLYTAPQRSLANPEIRAPVKELAWGLPEPAVVNRVFAPLDAQPGGLVVQPVLAYEAVDGSKRDPSYLFDLKSFAHSGTANGGGYIGTDPSAGLSALDMADIVVQVRGDKRCIPYQVAVIETESTITVGVYYGQPDTKDHANIAHITECATDGAEADSTSVLVPINLSDGVLNRAVVNFDGSPITQVGAAAKKPATK